jgi:hypothetical protein
LKMFLQPCRFRASPPVVGMKREGDSAFPKEESNA